MFCLKCSVLYFNITYFLHLSSGKDSKEYWNIREYRDGAQVFLDLKEVLKLTGDFTIVQKFASSVRVHILEYFLKALFINEYFYSMFLARINKSSKN